MAASFSGRLLVSNPEMRDPNFYRTVVLLFEHGEDGAFGTVLNRPTEETAGEHLPEWAHLLANPPVVFIGGPVRNEIAVGVAEWSEPDELEGDGLFSGVGFIDLTDPPDPDSPPQQVRVFSGYSGWDAGQLEVELAIDSWFILEPIVEDVFGDPTDLWSRASCDGNQAGLGCMPNTPTIYRPIEVTTTVPHLRSAIKGKSPSLDHERQLWARGKTAVVGMDEVGRGAWAGPVSVGAVILPQGRRIYKIRDSKMLTEAEREAIFDRLAEWCTSWCVGHASPQECDQLGMSAAMTLAAQRALAGLAVDHDHLLLDGNWDFARSGDTDLLVRGDARSLSIATASILAKVTRDRLMRETSEEFPAYAFEGNKGYPGPIHKAALHAVGPSTVHRRSWVFMDGLSWSGVKRLVRPDSQQRLFD